MNLFFSHACDKKSPRTLGFHIKYHNSLNTHKCVILEKIKRHCKEKAIRLFQERGRLLEKEITVLEPSDARTKSFHSDVQFFLRDILANFIDSRFLQLQNMTSLISGTVGLQQYFSNEQITVRPLISNIYCPD